MSYIILISQLVYKMLKLLKRYFPEAYTRNIIFWDSVYYSDNKQKNVDNIAIPQQLRHSPAT